MNRFGILGSLLLLAVIAVPANAQLTSTDNGAAAIDKNGLMWANTVGTNLTWSATGAAGSAQAWVAGLNASDYGGYNNWTLASGNGSFGANTTTNQLGELFYSDCGNAAGGTTVLNNPGKGCGALSSLNTALNATTNGIGPGAIFFSSSLYPTSCGGGPCEGSPYWWSYISPNSSEQPWNSDTQFGDQVGTGDAVAVRSVPEIDPLSTAGGLTLLLGVLAMLRDRRRGALRGKAAA
jgi:hypothetical protein